MSALIEVRNLHKHYRMGEEVVRALNGVSVDIQAGEFVAITGASGSGKSTLMHLIGCLDRPTSGTYKLDGRDVSRVSDGTLADIRNQQIGFVFQTFNLINRTSAIENVSVPMFYARQFNGREAALKALERVGLTPRATHKPSELSGGERQRVAIARALVNDPLLLLADEPTGNLDSRTGEQIMALFHELNRQGVTIVLVTHDQDVALQAQRVIHMRDGKVVYDCPTSELLRESPANAHPVATQASPTARQVSATRDAAPPTALPAAETAVEPAAESAAAPLRRVGGATVALWLGGLAWVSLAGWVFSVIQMFQATPPEWRVSGPPKVMKPEDVPPALMQWGVVFVAASMALLGLGVAAMVLGALARRKIRNELEPLAGAGRARVGFWLGLSAMLAPPLAWLGTTVWTALR